MRSTNYTLSPTRINNAKAKVKPYKLSDGGGLLIEVSASGLRADMTRDIVIDARCAWRGSSGTQPSRPG